MKITMYELLGLVKDGKAPKKIKYRDKIWEYVSTIKGTGYQYYSNFFENWETLQNQVYLEECLNDEVEIIEEPKKIEKVDLFKLDESMSKASLVDWQRANNGVLKEKIDELIDEINNLKEKKDE